METFTYDATGRVDARQEQPPQPLPAPYVYDAEARSRLPWGNISGWPCNITYDTGPRADEPSIVIVTSPTAE